MQTNKSELNPVIEIEDNKVFAQVASQLEPASIQPEPGENMRVLVVDDDRGVRTGGGKTAVTAQIVAALMSSGVDVSSIPGMKQLAPKPVKVLTGHDIIRMKAAEEKRKRKANKRAGITEAAIVICDEGHIPMG